MRNNVVIPIPQVDSSQAEFDFLIEQYFNLSIGADRGVVGCDLDDPEKIIPSLHSRIPRTLVKGLEGVAILFRIILRRGVDVAINRGLCGRTKSVFIFIYFALWIQHRKSC